MRKATASIVFVQGFGNADLFTGIAPESLWGWRRNVGILIALLNQKGIAWKECYARRLSEVNEQADLFFLRDWRYGVEEIHEFRLRYRDTPMVSMLFQGPQRCLESQRLGEKRALFGITDRDPHAQSIPHESGLFATDCVIVRSKLNADLFAQLGYPKDKMVLLPHAPVWTLHNGDFLPVEFPPAGNVETKPHGKGLDLLFIGESLLRKGLFRLYRAFSALNIPGKRLHLYNRTLYRYAKGMSVHVPAHTLQFVRQILADPAVFVHPAYQNLAQLAQAHAGIDLIVCPSLLDNGPNVLVESYQLGTPILSSDLCGAAFDLPRGAVSYVTAPKWWQQEETPHAFTIRLAEKIACKKLGANRPDRSTVASLIETIVQTWERLLDKYLCI